MRHPLVVSRMENKLQIVLMNQLPANREWKDIIGFNPIKDFGHVSVANSYLMNVGARSREAATVQLVCQKSGSHSLQPLWRSPN